MIFPDHLPMPAGPVAADPGEGVRRVRRARRVRALLDAALALVGERGVDGWTVAELAREVELTPGALYRYFASKDEIIVALQVGVLQELLARWGQVARALAERLPDPPPPREAALLSLLLAARAHADLAERSPERFALITQSVADPRTLVQHAETAAVWEHTLGLVGAVVTACERARSAGALSGGSGSGDGPGDTLDRSRALLLLFGGQGIIQLHKLARRMPGVIDVPALSRRFTRDLLLGWGAAPAEVAAAEARIDAHPALFALPLPTTAWTHVTDGDPS